MKKVTLEMAKKIAEYYLSTGHEGDANYVMECHDDLYIIDDIIFIEEQYIKYKHDSIIIDDRHFNPIGAESLEEIKEIL